MAIVKLNPAFLGIRGTLGNVVFKHYGDKVVLTRKPRFENRVFSPAQRASQERFRKAMRYATSALADPNTRSAYEKAAAATGKPIVSLMVADFLRRPESERQRVPSPKDSPAVRTANVPHCRSQSQAISAGSAWYPTAGNLRSLNDSGNSPQQGRERTAKRAPPAGLLAPLRDDARGNCAPQAMYSIFPYLWSKTGFP